MVNMTDFTLKHMVLRLLTIAAAVSALLSGCKPIEKEENSKDYGVFISLDSSDMDEIMNIIKTEDIPQTTEYYNDIKELVLTSE